MSQVEQSYSLIFKIIFWLLWLAGVAVFIVYAMLSVMTLNDGNSGYTSGLIGPWNLLITVAEGIVLLYSVGAFMRGDKPAAVLVLWVLLAVVVIPLIGFGGCVMQ